MSGQYTGIGAKSYQQTNGKLIFLNPAIERAIPRIKNNEAAFLDIACGSGDFAPMAISKGYKYFGLDNAPDMIKIALNIIPLIRINL